MGDDNSYQSSETHLRISGRTETSYISGVPNNAAIIPWTWSLTDTVKNKQRTVTYYTNSSPYSSENNDTSSSLRLELPFTALTVVIDADNNDEENIGTNGTINLMFTWLP